MTFTSWEFAGFVVVVLLGLRLLPARALRQLLIVAASTYFYARWHASYLLLLGVPIVVDYWCARRIEAAGAAAGTRKALLGVSIVTDLGLLAYFKYAGFFVANVARLTGMLLQPLDVLLPVGISFFTLKSLSYTIDVYRGDLPACRSLWRYALFVGYFPTLLAGPIVRASTFLPQLSRSLRPSWSRTWFGAQMVLLGLTKKLVIADQLAPFVDEVFLRPAEYSPLTVASGVVAYSLQIYCDFSGYSDIAIGVSTMIGFDLPENFNLPYLATSLAEFWRRWHIALSTWLRDYLYIPLGGNRRGRGRTLANLLVTMVLGGLWHGASWTFVVWGGLHGVGLVIHRLWRDTAAARVRPLHGAGGWLLTYPFVCVAWIFFRADDLGAALRVLRKAVGLDQGGVAWLYSPLLLILPLVIVAHLIGLHVNRACRGGAPSEAIPAPAWAAAAYRRARVPFATRLHEAGAVHVSVPMPGVAGGFVLTLWLLLLVVFGAVRTSPFVYLQF